MQNTSMSLLWPLTKLFGIPLLAIIWVAYKTRKITAVLKSLTLFMIIGFVCFYWKVRNVDPEGACKDLKNFSICTDAYLWHEDSFKKLPSDQELIDQFMTHRNYFFELEKMALSQRTQETLILNQEQKNALGISIGNNYMYWPPSTYSAKYERPSKPSEYAFFFSVETTMYVAGAEKNWPLVNRVKGYVYFPKPIPIVEHGRLAGPLRPDGKHTSWNYVLEQLDGNWPANWKSGECLLRRIDPQWFLFIYKDQIGG